MVKYSPKAAKALAFLKRTGNDVDIFVEDTTNRNMWAAIIKKFLPAGVNFKSVNMLGGRDAVLSACKLDQVSDGRRKLYIIDGDFDFLQGKKKPRLKFLYRIGGYCVENILINEKSCLDLGLCCCPNASELEVRDTIKFDEWIKNDAQKLIPLFVVYAAVNKLAPQISTINYTLSNLFDAGRLGPSISANKVRSRIRQIYRSGVRASSLVSLAKARREISQTASSLGLEKIVSGKDYLIPILSLRISAAFKQRFSHDQLKVFLANGWDGSNDRNLVRRLKGL